MSTSQKKSSTLLPFQERAPTSSPFPRENSPLSWMKVKFLKLAALKRRPDTVTQGPRLAGQNSLENAWSRPAASHHMSSVS